MRTSVVAILVIGAMLAGVLVGMNANPVEAQDAKDSETQHELYYSTSEGGGIAYRWDFTNMTVHVCSSGSGEWELVHLKEKK